MITITAASIKGGVGKTTAILALGLEAAKKGLNTVILDLDDQASATGSLMNLDDIAEPHTAYTLLQSEDGFSPVVVRDSLALVPASLKLLEIDKEEGNFELHYRLREQIETHLKDYDLVLIDTPGTLRTRVVAAVAASHYVFTPIELSEYSLKSFMPLSTLLTWVRRRLNPDLKFLGFLPNRVQGIKEEGGKKVPNQTDERKIYNRLLEIGEGKDNIIGLIGQRKDIRTSITSGHDLSPRDSENARQEILDFVDRVLTTIQTSCN